MCSNPYDKLVSYQKHQYQNISNSNQGQRYHPNVGSVEQAEHQHLRCHRGCNTPDTHENRWLTAKHHQLKQQRSSVYTWNLAAYEVRATSHACLCVLCKFCTKTTHNNTQISNPAWWLWSTFCRRQSDGCPQDNLTDWLSDRLTNIQTLLSQLSSQFVARIKMKHRLTSNTIPTIDTWLCNWSTAHQHQLGAWMNEVLIVRIKFTPVLLKSVISDCVHMYV